MKTLTFFLFLFIPALLLQSSEREWVKRYPEMLWLADQSVAHTEEGTSSSEGSSSERLFGKKYIEFDRMILNLHSLHLIREGTGRAYAQFTKGQKEESRLKRESFAALHGQIQEILNSHYRGLSPDQMLEAMETAIVLAELGKSGSFRVLCTSLHIKAPDQDDFHEELMAKLELDEHSELCPSFTRLHNPARYLLTEGANLAHYGHITHLEGDARMFSKLRNSGVIPGDPFVFTFNYFAHICDVAGALGHVMQDSSIVYTEDTFQALEAVRKSCILLVQEGTTEADALAHYVSMRGEWIDLDSQDPIDQILIQVGAMLRLFSPEEGIVLKEAFGDLEPSQQKIVLAQFLTQDALQRTPTYVPAVLVNLANNKALGATWEERLTQAVQLGLPYIAHALKVHKEQLALGKADPQVPLNFNAVAGVAKTAPDSLKTFECTIDSDGVVRMDIAKR